MDTSKKNREHISALSDGEIRDADQELAFAALDTPDGRQAWGLYHHIGDILRAEATADFSPGFGERLAARLAAEPAPGKRVAATPESADTTAAVGRVDGSTASI
jgi:sigma-E factor negative regulatory protein RseA